MDWNNRNDINSAVKVGRVIEEEKEKERQKEIEKIKTEQHRKLQMQEQIKSRELMSKNESEKLQFEKVKEKNNWKRAFITWSLSLTAIIISIIALIFSLRK